MHPEEDVQRTTASALWGENKITREQGENAALLEAALRMKRWEIYTRYEWVQKSTEELALDAGTFGEHTLFPVNEGTLGLTYDVLQLAKTRLALGAHATWFHGDAQRAGIYGRNPVGGEVCIRLYPALMKMKM